MGIKVTGDLAKLYGDKEGYMELAVKSANLLCVHLESNPRYLG